jgi:hypothetical protein
MTIKPEDIPNSMVWVMFGETLTPQTIAGLLNEAIEAGVVSPPCHVIRHAVGMYIHDPGYGRKIRVWPGKPPEDHPRAEHYKGQE